jgi:threonine aldolase
MEAMKKENILMYQISPNQIRMVLHLDITPAMVEKTIQTIHNL